MLSASALLAQSQPWVERWFGDIVSMVFFLICAGIVAFFFIGFLRDEYFPKKSDYGSKSSHISEGDYGGYGDNWAYDSAGNHVGEWLDGSLSFDKGSGVTSDAWDGTYRDKFGETIDPPGSDYYDDE